MLRQSQISVMLCAATLMVVTTAFASENPARLASSVYIPQTESLPSCCDYVDLATPDIATFRLATKSLVTIWYNATGFGGYGNGNIYNILQIDGTNLDGTNGTDNTENTISVAPYWNGQMSIIYTLKLDQGNHTVKVLHKSNGNGGSFSNRSILVQSYGP